MNDTKKVFILYCMVCMVFFAENAMAQPDKPEPGPRVPMIGGGPNHPGDRREGERHGPNGMRHRGDDLRFVLERLKRDNPKEAERLENLKNTNRDEYLKELRKLYAEQFRMMNKVMQLEKECWMLGHQYRTARTQAEKDAIMKELEAKVEESFQAMVEESKQRLEDIKHQLEELETHKEELNKKRLSKFLEGRTPPLRNGGASQPAAGNKPPFPPPADGK